MKNNNTLIQFLEITGNELVRNYSGSEFKKLCQKYEILGIKYQYNRAFFLKEDTIVPKYSSVSGKEWGGHYHTENHSEEKTSSGWINGLWVDDKSVVIKSNSIYTKKDLFGDKYSSLYDKLTFESINPDEILHLPFHVGSSTFIWEGGVTINIKEEYVYQDSDSLFYQLLAEKTMKEKLLVTSQEQVLVVCSKENFSEKFKYDIFDLFKISDVQFYEKDSFYSYVFKYKIERYFDRVKVVMIDSYRYNDDKQEYGIERFYYSDMKLYEDYINKSVSVNVESSFIFNYSQFSRCSSSHPCVVGSYSRVLKFNHKVRVLDAITERFTMQDEINLEKYEVYFGNGYFALNKYQFSFLVFFLKNGYNQNPNCNRLQEELLYFKEVFKDDQYSLKKMEEYIRYVNYKQKIQVEF